jgi:hypothetical protein
LWTNKHRNIKWELNGEEHKKVKKEIHREEEELTQVTSFKYKGCEPKYN